MCRKLTVITILLKIKMIIDMFGTEKCKVTFGFKYTTRDDPKVLIFTLKLCPETFLRGILCTIEKTEFLPL